MRGTHDVGVEQVGAHGSIPAGAGNPETSLAGSEDEGVYPRGCGEPLFLRHDLEFSKGLSPRVRGTRRSRRSARARAGSIPAGAGNPSVWGRCFWLQRVYPRGCGEPFSSNVAKERVVGLSPRVRGTLEGGGASRTIVGSIPAGAGNPVLGWIEPGDGGVYPRGCGEPVPSLSRPESSRGLSPRVRGTQLHRAAKRPGPGSIPAGAGNPHT